MSYDAGSAAAQTTTSAFVDLAGSEWNCRYLKTKTIVIRNTGGTNGASVTVLGTTDTDNRTYDQTVLASTNIAAGASTIVKLTDWYAYVKIQVKDQTGGSHTTVSASWGGVDA